MTYSAVSSGGGVGYYDSPALSGISSIFPIFFLTVVNELHRVVVDSTIFVALLWALIM